MGSFIIIEHAKSDISTDFKFWYGGKYGPKFQTGIYQAFNFGSMETAKKRWKRSNKVKTCISSP